MLILILFAFLAGVVTILSPCILPILPIILASSAGDASSQRRPYGIIAGFVLSFTFFTLFLSSLVKLLGVPADALRTLSVVVIATFGLTLLLPRFQLVIEQLFSRLANLMPSTTGKTGFSGGLLIGLSLGLLWTPCVGPILASVISLAISGTVTFDAFLITMAYSLGTALPMYLIILGGRQVFSRFPSLLRRTSQIQRVFGLIMIITAALIYLGVDRTFQSYILTRFPQYGTGLTKFEDNAIVKTKLDTLGNQAPELIPGGDWFNTDPLTLANLKGKVVLIDFWTYTCINCQRTFPYLKAWHEKYRDKGLVIIGVHSPEFEFEKNPLNLAKAITDFGIQYPVMQDNDFATWQAYQNRYWPAKYFIDKDGFIRHTHFGEGDYDESEAVIQALLKETGVEVTDELNNPDYTTSARTPETYLGSLRSQGESYLTYDGPWQQSGEYSAPSPHASLNLTFDAQSVYLVMRPTSEVAKVEVYLDGVMLKTITVSKDTLYTLVDLPNPGRHQLRLVFPDGKIELYAFTFG